MHAPDGLFTAGTAMATGGLAGGAVAFCLRQARETLGDRQIPLAGVSAAFIFAAQMANFPVAAGTTGHLLGGALAAILLGPAVGALVVAVVVVVQALIFADGGLTALGINVLNMAIVTSFGGYALFRGLRRLLPDNGSGVVLASGLAAGLSVVLSAAAFSVEWLFGASAPVPFDTVFGAMVGVHTLVGIGEGIMTGLAVGAVLGARPDLVHGAADLGPAARAQRPPVGRRAVAAGVLLVALLFATVVSQFSGTAPDGLQRVASDTAIDRAVVPHDLQDTFFAGYATEGLGDERLSLAVAGVAGVAITSLLMAGLILAVRPRRRHEHVADAESSSTGTGAP